MRSRFARECWSLMSELCSASNHGLLGVIGAPQQYIVVTPVAKNKNKKKEYELSIVLIFFFSIKIGVKLLIFAIICHVVRDT